MKQALITIMMAAVLAIGVVGLPGCDMEQTAAELQAFQADLDRIEQRYGPILDDPNAMAGEVGELVKRKLAAEMKALDQKYGAILADPNGAVQRGVGEFDRYAPAARGVVSVLPTPAREAGLAIIGIAGTIAAALRGRRWKNSTQELLYARQRLESRVAASGIDTEAFKIQRSKAEGEALNPATARIIQ